MKTNTADKAAYGDNRSRCLLLFVIIICLLNGTLVQAEVCLLAKQLKDPYIRAEYTEIIAENRTNSMNRDVEDLYGNAQAASFSAMPSFAGNDMNSRLDSISMECIACHDGVLAREAKHRISDGDLNRARSMETIKGAHPIGMEYERYSRGNREYVPENILPADMVLMNGKVTCVTCHDMLGKNRMHLVVENSRSGLCFSCHMK